MEIKRQNQHPLPYERFTIGARDIDEKRGIVKFHYQFDDALHCTETIDFGHDFSDLGPDRMQALERAFAFLHIAAGVSYYKAFIPPVIDLGDTLFDQDCEAFFQDFYTQGLGEFAYRNDLNLSGYIKFRYDSSPVDAADLSLQDRSLVLFGGGKDSIVTTEILKGFDDLTLFAVNPVPEITEGIKCAGLDSLFVKRTLDPALYDWNEAGAYNGHVPVTGVLSFVAVCASIIHGYNRVVLSNERSANEGNLVRDGISVNHQYSKSFEFEDAISKFIAHKMLRNLSYFSFLRPLSEYQIAQQFSKVESYDYAFSSCNANFKIRDRQDHTKWCCDCPKCRFSFLIFAPFMDKDRLIKIFGENLLADLKHLEGYEALTGLSSHKPWECVGEIMECKLAFYDLSQASDWRGEPIVQSIWSRLKADEAMVMSSKQDYLALSDNHIVPPVFLKGLKDALA